MANVVAIGAQTMWPRSVYVIEGDCASCVYSYTVQLLPCNSYSVWVQSVIRETCCQLAMTLYIRVYWQFKTVDWGLRLYDVHVCSLVPRVLPRKGGLGALLYRTCSAASIDIMHMLSHGITPLVNLPWKSAAAIFSSKNSLIGPSQQLAFQESSKMVRPVVVLVTVYQSIPELRAPEYVPKSFCESWQAYIANGSLLWENCQPKEHLLVRNAQPVSRNNDVPLFPDLYIQFR